MYKLMGFFLGLGGVFSFLFLVTVYFPKASAAILVLAMIGAFSVISDVLTGGPKR